MLPRKRYKRSRNEHIKWWGGVAAKGARRWLTARRQGARAGVGVQNETIKPRGLLEASPEFGGSGARFASLRNRRGVRGGADGLIQTRLKLSIVPSGDGKFSLFAGESVGK